MKKALLAIAVLAILSGNSSATIVLSDNFDGYADQAAYVAAWPAIGTVAPTSTALSTAQAVSPTKSVQLPVSTANGQQRNRRSFTETGAVGIGDQIIWSFDYYDTAPTGAPQRNSLNLQDTTAPGSANQLISIGFNNNQTGANSGGQFYMARILGFAPVAPYVDPDGGPNETGTLNNNAPLTFPYVKLNDFGVGSRSLGWHNLKVVITTDDALSTDYYFYVDNVLAERVLNIGTAAQIRSYDNITIGSGLTNGGTEAFVDNMRLEFVQAVIPEAGSIAAMSMVGLISAAAVWIRKRRTVA